MTTSSELLKLARRHVGKDYRLGAIAPKSNANWSGPWDCAEFTSWCVYQLTGTLFGCRPRNGDPDRADAYSGFWADDARALECDVAVGQAAGTKGAFLVRLPGSAIGHVAISDGRGGTVEAHSRRAGVIEGFVRDRRWDIGVLVPGMDVSIPERPLPVEAPGIVLRVKPMRMRGVLVYTVQRALVAAGFAPGPIDGIYGGKTAGAVRAFQIQKGLAADGEVGTPTAKALGIDWLNTGREACRSGEEA